MGCRAVGVEIDPELALKSVIALDSLRSDAGPSGGREVSGPVSGAHGIQFSVQVIAGDAAEVELGERFDRVVFSAALEAVPAWALERLTPEGFVLAPIGTYGMQELERVYADGGRERTGRLCRFVPFR
jgi:hypothetical protein